MRKLLTDAERLLAEAGIAAQPELWPIVAGTGGARKARVRRGSRGRSGGARIIYFYRSRAGEIYLIMIYAKNEQENLTHAQKQEIRKIVAAVDQTL